MRTFVLSILCVLTIPLAAAADDARPTVGVAFGGGSARGIAHVGVIRWFEEHRIPIDMAAGTSMGGLIGGAFATGMDAAELDDMLKHMNWDEMFGASSFAFKNIRRKADARAYPSRLEFGLKHGIVPPAALNNGEQVDLLVGRIAAPYYAAPTFDDLPTPFRAVVDGSADGLDGGARPRLAGLRDARDDVAAADFSAGASSTAWCWWTAAPWTMSRRTSSATMGAARVVAVNVGDLADLKTADTSLLGLAGADARRHDARQHRKLAIKQADIIINVPLTAYGSLDWRRSTELIAEGYKAAEAMRDSLLPLSVSETDVRGLEEPAARRAGGPCFRSRPSSASRASARAMRAASAISWPTMSARLRRRSVSNRTGGALRPRSVRDDHLALRQQSGRRDRRAGGGAPEVERSAVPDAGPQPREHDLGRLSGSR